MAKSGPLGKAESFYVEEKYKAGDSIEQIAHDLDRAVNSIQKYISKNKVKHTQATIIDQQFIRQQGATIMTENASSMIDQNRKPINTKNNNCITKIK